MSYQLSAVVADVELLREQTADLDHAVLAALRQDFALLPVTPQLVQELTGGLPDFATDEPRAERPFRLVLSPPLAEVLARWAPSGPGAGRGGARCRPVAEHRRGRSDRPIVQTGRCDQSSICGGAASIAPRVGGIGPASRPKSVAMQQLAPNRDEQGAVVSQIVPLL